MPARKLVSAQKDVYHLAPLKTKLGASKHLVFGVNGSNPELLVQYYDDDEEDDFSYNEWHCRLTSQSDCINFLLVHKKGDEQHMLVKLRLISNLIIKEGVVIPGP